MILGPDGTCLFIEDEILAFLKCHWNINQNFINYICYFVCTFCIETGLQIHISNSRF
jgi:hypothetical protein